VVADRRGGAEPPKPERPSRTAEARRLIAGCAIIIAIGVWLVGTVSRDVGGPVVLVGWAGMVLGIHWLGRS
jgi:hypothetical protein